MSADSDDDLPVLIDADSDEEGLQSMMPSRAAAVKAAVAAVAAATAAAGKGRGSTQVRMRAAGSAPPCSGVERMLVTTCDSQGSFMGRDQRG